MKEDIAALLRAELGAPSWTPKLVTIGGVTDPYQPVEKRLRLTRACLEVFAELRNPCSVVTKSGLVARDIDVLQELARFEAVTVYVSVTTLDPALHRVLEPRSSAPWRRLAAIEALAKAGVPVGALVAPVIPGLTDHEIPAIVTACARAGARVARHILLRLPHAVAPLFEDWLDAALPGATRQGDGADPSRARRPRERSALPLANDGERHLRRPGARPLRARLPPRRTRGRGAAALDALLSTAERIRSSISLPPIDPASPLAS